MGRSLDGRNKRRRLTAPFVATADGARALGFHTLSATSIELIRVPTALAKKLPRYFRLPATPIRFVRCTDDLAALVAAP